MQTDGGTAANGLVHVVNRFCVVICQRERSVSARVARDNTNF
jgi:hypothetical protein